MKCLSLVSSKFTFNIIKNNKKVLLRQSYIIFSNILHTIFLLLVCRDKREHYFHIITIRCYTMNIPFDINLQY